MNYYIEPSHWQSWSKHYFSNWISRSTYKWFWLKLAWYWKKMGTNSSQVHNCIRNGLSLPWNLRFAGWNGEFSKSTKWVEQLTITCLFLFHRTSLNSMHLNSMQIWYKLKWTPAKLMIHCLSFRKSASIELRRLQNTLD